MGLAMLVALENTTTREEQHEGKSSVGSPL